MYLTKTAFECKKKVTTNSLSSSPSSQVDITPALQKYLHSCISSKRCHYNSCKTTQFTSIPSHSAISNRSNSKPGKLSIISFYHKQQTFTPVQERFPSIHANDHYIILKPYKYKSTPNKPAASNSPFNPPFLSQTVHKRNLLFLLRSLSFFLRSLLRDSTLDNGTKGRRRKNACLHITAVKPQQTRPKRTATV